MDAGDFVADPARRGTADVLCVDLYDHEAASPVLDSAAFYRGCHALLADGGVMTVNLFGRDASFERSRRAHRRGLRRRRACDAFADPRGQHHRAGDEACHVPGPRELAARAENIETRWQLPARKWLRMLRLKPEPDPAPLPDLPPA